MAEKRFSHRGFAADTVFKHIRTRRGDKPVRLFGVILFDINGHGIKQAERVGIGIDRHDFGGFDHILQIADPAVIGVFFLLGDVVFRIFTEIAERACTHHFL